MPLSKTNLSFKSIVLFLLYSIALIALFYYLYDGLNYYMTPLLERPHHPDHQNIKPGGIRGHGLGILGTMMMILLLTYSLRKKNLIFGNIGRIGDWLDFHISLGIMGPLFVILHSSFKLNGIVAISFWSMISVALSGVLGRYLYLQIPRNISGHEINLTDVEKTNEQILVEIESNYTVDRTYVAKMEKLIVGNLDPDKSELYILVSFLMADIFRFFRIKKIRRILRRSTRLSKKQIKILIGLMKKKAYIHRRLILWNKIHQLFHYWHVFHKPFAFVMYFIMIVHVVLTILLGYTWIF
jgi:hypothetical protein